MCTLGNPRRPLSKRIATEEVVTQDSTGKNTPDLSSRALLAVKENLLDSRWNYLRWVPRRGLGY